MELDKLFKEKLSTYESKMPPNVFNNVIKQLEETEKKQGAKRYNKGKTRYELIPTFAKKCLAEVYTKGAHKYSVYKDKEGNKILGKDIPLESISNYELIEDASDNWRKGLPWMDTIASVERHIEEWKQGIDKDHELSTYHLANAAWGMFTLLEYYKIHPEGDNRPSKALSRYNIGLDIDEVLCDFIGGWIELYGDEIGYDRPNSWYFDRDMVKRFDKMRENDTLDQFYLSLKPLVNPKDLPFEPRIYITSRPVDSNITEQWLDMHGFPKAKVITVPCGSSKVKAALENNITLFIDDKYDNFEELNEAGILTYLYDAKHNHKYPVKEHLRLYNLKELQQ